MQTIFIFGHWLTGLLYFYFMYNFLTPRWSKKKTIIVSLVSILSAITICDLLMYQMTFLKPFIGFIVLIINALFAFNDSISKRVKVTTLACILSLFGEIIYTFIALLFYGKAYIMSTPAEHLLTILLCHFIIFILFQIVILKPFKLLLASSKVLWILLFYFLSTIIVISNLYDGSLSNCVYNHTAQYHEIMMHCTVIIMLIMPFLIILMFIYLIRMERKIMDETMSQEINHEYEKHLSALSAQNKADAYIRHDLINYIETYQRLQQKTGEVQ